MDLSLFFNNKKIKKNKKFQFNYLLEIELKFEGFPCLLLFVSGFTFDSLSLEGIL